MTAHAIRRSQQRGIPPLIVDLLLQFGTRERSHGAEIVYFDRRSRKRVASYTGGLFGKLDEHLDAYAVVCDERIVTTGIRHKRVPNA